MSLVSDIFSCIRHSFRRERSRTSGNGLSKFCGSLGLIKVQSLLSEPYQCNSNKMYGFRANISTRKGRRKDKDSPTPPGLGEELKEYLQEDNLRDRVSDADFFKLVALPPYLDLNEWLATHTISFFNHVNLLYGVVSEYCTAETCPSMSAPDNVQYFWYDDKGKKSKHTAPQYIDFVMAHIQKLVNDEAVFPTKFDHAFPADLEVVVKRIHKYLFHVLAHMYHAHYSLLRQLHLHAHLNTVFTHLMVFTSKFDLVPDRETDILLPLFSLLLKNLADPAQNPKLREGLGIGEDELSIFASKSSSASEKPSAAGEKGSADLAEESSLSSVPSLSTNPASAVTVTSEMAGVHSSITSSASSSPSHFGRGDGGHDSGVGEEDSISGVSVTAASALNTRAGTPDSCNSKNSAASFQVGAAGVATAQPDSSRLAKMEAASKDGGFLSSSFPPAQQQLFQPPASLLSSSPQRVSNGVSSLALHLPFSCDNRTMTAHPGHVVDCTNQAMISSATRKSPLSAASPMFPHPSLASSSPPHRTGLLSHQERVGEEGVDQRSASPMVVDVDPTKPPSEWLSSMQVSAT
ncbi:mob kinase activator 2 [Plakobranchus ocellatus]|uniref:Mob kinase activator 2 n=1 Tax=Plakobranchus ocellatus TaxID=259542 RepID=A0AAV3ZXT8_9GAST|nr:mob kinase activator 2 [Plakobranchus ocellatus]